MFDDLVIGRQWCLNPEDITLIAADYGLVILDEEVQLLGGATNGVARVASNKGEVVVRVHRPWTTPARLSSVHRIQGQLREDSLPIPAILRTHTGSTWSRLYNRLVEVTQYVPNHGEADTWERMEVAFAMLGRAHNSLARLSRLDIVPPPYSSYMTPQTALGMIEKTEPIFRSFKTHEGYYDAAAVRSTTYDLMRRLAAERERYESSLPSCIIHGDYGTGNVLIRDSEVVAILDFDFMAYRERIFDLAYSLYWTLDRLRDSTAKAPFSDSELARAAGLLREYSSTATSLTDTEIDALPFEMARVPLYPVVEAGYTAGVPYAADPVAHTLSFAYHLPIAVALASESVQVRVILTGELV